MTAVPTSKASHILLLIVLLGAVAVLTRLAAQRGALAPGALPFSRGPGSSAPGSAALVETPLDIADIDTYVNEQVQRHGVPGLALAFLGGIRLVIVPGLGGQSWYEVLTAFPDLVLWIWALGLAGLATGVGRLVVIWRVRRGVAQPEASPVVSRSAGLPVN